MQIEYKLDDGKVLNVMQLGKIAEFYNAMCTAEYIQDTYNIVNEDLAKELGYCARNIMNKYDYSEDEAINQLMRDEKYKNYFTNNNYLDSGAANEKKISAKEKAKEKALLNGNAGERSFLQQK